MYYTLEPVCVLQHENFFDFFLYDGKVDGLFVYVWKKEQNKILYIRLSGIVEFIRR